MALRPRCTPMLVACQKGHLEVTQRLFSAGGDVRTADRYGCTLMLMACRDGHFEDSQWLICNGAANNRLTRTTQQANHHRDPQRRGDWKTSAGHIDASVMDTLRGTGRLPGLQRALVPFWSSVFFLSITQIQQLAGGWGVLFGAGQVMVYTAPAI